MGLYNIIHGIKPSLLKEERATWVIGYERDGKEYSWSTSANSSGEAQRAFDDYMEGQGVDQADYRVKGTYQSTTNDVAEAYEDWSDGDSGGNVHDYTSDYEDQDNAKSPYGDGGFDDVCREAQRISKEEGVTQHVNITADGSYVVDDWYDSDNTAVSFHSGRKESNPSFSGEYVDNSDDYADDMNEENTTSNLDGGLGQPKIPGIFQRNKPTSSDKSKERKNATSSTGWNIKPKTNNYIKRRDEIFARAEDLITQLDEARYTDYASDTTKTAKEKINSSIHEVNRKLYEIEHMIDHAVRLKTESGIDDVFWKPTKAKFAKISERMLRIGTKLREFNS